MAPSSQPPSPSSSAAASGPRVSTVPNGLYSLDSIRNLASTVLATTGEAQAAAARELANLLIPPSHHESNGEKLDTGDERVNKAVDSPPHDSARSHSKKRNYETAFGEDGQNHDDEASDLGEGEDQDELEEYNDSSKGEESDSADTHDQYSNAQSDISGFEDGSESGESEDQSQDGQIVGESEGEEEEEDSEEDDDEDNTSDSDTTIFATEDDEASDPSDDAEGASSDTLWAEEEDDGDESDEVNSEDEEGDEVEVEYDWDDEEGLLYRRFQISLLRLELP